MDGVLICLDSIRQDLMTRGNTFYDDSQKFSAEFAEVLKEILESELQGSSNTGYELFPMNREERNSVKEKENERNGLLRRQKLCTVLEPCESFPAKTGLSARRASFPAIGSPEELSMNGINSAGSCPDNCMASLLNELPRIEEVCDEDRVGVSSCSKVAKQDKRAFRAKTPGFKKLSPSRNTTPRSVNQTPRRFSNCSTKASRKNNSIKNEVVANKSENWKIRVHKRTIIDDDTDTETSSQSSKSGLSSRPASWSGESTSRFPTIDPPAKKHSY